MKDGAARWRHRSLEMYVALLGPDRVESRTGTDKTERPRLVSHPEPARIYPDTGLVYRSAEMANDFWSPERNGLVLAAICAMSVAVRDPDKVASMHGRSPLPNKKAGSQRGPATCRRAEIEPAREVGSAATAPTRVCRHRRQNPPRKAFRGRLIRPT